MLEIRALPMLEIQALHLMEIRAVPLLDAINRLEHVRPAPVAKQPPPSQGSPQWSCQPHVST